MRDPTNIIAAWMEKQGRNGIWHALECSTEGEGWHAEIVDGNEKWVHRANGLTLNGALSNLVQELK